jgi:PAS domain S-box-containing protein
MPAAPIPAHEADRLRALRHLLILDTAPEKRFDRLTRLARRLFDTEMALVTLVDESRQWFKSRQGVNVCETSRDLSFSAHVVAADDVLVVADATRDPRFADNPAVTKAGGIRFYAGEVLRSNDGFALGTFCVADSRPRTFSATDRAALRELADIAQDEINSPTELRLARLLHESEERFHLLVSASEAGFFDHDHVTGRVFTSTRWKALLGYTEAELPDGGFDWLDFVHPEDRVRFTAPDQQRPAGTHPFNYELRLRHRDGAWRRFRSQGVEIISAATGLRERALGFHTDVTARRGLEERARLLELVVRDVNEGISVTDVDVSGDGPRFVYVNPALCRMFGYPADELVGQPATTLHGPQTDPAVLAAWREALAAGRPFAADVVHHRRDGSPVEVEWHVAPVRDDADLISHWVGLRRDISLRKQTERELQSARDSAIAANEAKSRFLANMSHEIRTPLNGIIGMAELLASTTLGPEQRDYIETILTSSDNLLTIINDVLDFSKIEHGGLELDLIPFAPADLADEVVGLLSYRAAAKDLELTAIVDPAVPPGLRGDANRIRQILLNLVANAIKFTEQGEVQLELSAAPDDDGLPRITCKVRDTGIGIPADRLDRLFKVFSQVDASTTRRYGGTGLGLVISRRLAVAMGGDITVASTPGEGTCFTVTLPLPPADEVPPPAQPALTGRRILIVDDHETNRQMLALHLTGWGATCESFADAASALARLRSGPACDLALVDMQMPDRDGLGFAADVRTLPGARRPPLILCSSLGQTIDREHLGGLGFVGFLQKPLRRTLLAAAVNDALAPTCPLPARAARDGPTSGPADDITRLRLLVAEDNLVNRKVVLALLAQLGCTADFAEDGAQAVAAAMAKPYDVILMDVHMPVCDGLAATAELRRLLPAERRPYIIALTADALQGDREKCLAAGMHDYLTKPLKSVDLRSALSRVRETRSHQAT